MLKNRQVCLRLSIFPVVAGGFLLLSSPSAASDKDSIATLTSKAGVEVWIQPSDAMIKKDCEYRLELEADKEDNVDMLSDFSGPNDWRTHGDHQTVAHATAGEKPRAKLENAYYTILLRNCCGISGTAKIGGLRIQFQKMSGTVQYTTYNYTLYTASVDANFTVKAKAKRRFWNLTTEVGLAKGASCP